MIDLHTHSTASDGTLSPTQLLQQADENGLTAVALTDHDTVAGLDEFSAASRNHPSVVAVPGVEIAGHYHSSSLHIVGLWVDWHLPVLDALLKNVRRNRRIRNQQILEELDRLGVPIEEKTVAEVAGGEVVGRPHIAAALVHHRHVETSKQAFEQFLGGGSPAYVQRQLPSPAEVIATIHEAGGTAVWAHPLGMRSWPLSKLQNVLKQLLNAGIDGIEGLYSEYTPEQEALLQKLAADYDLLLSGGSDFHGDNMPGISLGTGHGNLMIPDAWLSPLRQRSEFYKSSNAETEKK